MKTPKLRSDFLIVAIFIFACLLAAPVAISNQAAAEGSSVTTVRNVLNTAKASDTDTSSDTNGGDNTSVLTSRAEVKTAEAVKTAREKLKTTVAKLAGEKLKKCQLRETIVGNIISRVSDRGTKQIGVLNAISEKVQAFYVDKKLTVSDYDALVSDVNAKKTDAEAALGNMTSISTAGFRCSDNAPKELITVFKDGVESKNDALKEYKTSINNLLVAVKTAAKAGEATSTTDTNGGQ